MGYDLMIFSSENHNDKDCIYSVSQLNEVQIILVKNLFCGLILVKNLFCGLILVKNLFCGLILVKNLFCGSIFLI